MTCLSNKYEQIIHCFNSIGESASMEKKKRLHVHPIYTASKERTKKEHNYEKKDKINKHAIDINI